MTKEGYTEGETEDLMIQTGESLEDRMIRQLELETLQKAMQSLTEVQRERLHLYFFSGLTFLLNYSYLHSDSPFVLVLLYITLNRQNCQLYIFIYPPKLGLIFRWIFYVKKSMPDRNPARQQLTSNCVI